MKDHLSYTTDPGFPHTETKGTSMSDTPRMDAMQRIQFEGCTVVVCDPETMEKWERELAAKELELAEQKQKFKDLNKELGCELRDPNGTIWEHAAKIQANFTELQRVAKELAWSSLPTKALAAYNNLPKGVKG